MRRMEQRREGGSVLGNKIKLLLSVSFMGVYSYFWGWFILCGFGE